LAIEPVAPPAAPSLPEVIATSVVAVPETVAAVEPAPASIAPPAGPAGEPAADPAAANQQAAFAASVDQTTGKVTLAFGSGNSVLLEFVEGLAKIQNTENNVVISSEFKADYVIDGFSPIATAANLRAQVNSLSEQLLALGAHGH
jgi:glycerol kinase